MPKSLFDDDDKVVQITALPDDIDAPTEGECDGTDWSLSIVSPFDLDAAESDRITQRAIGEPSNTEAFGKLNATGILNLFRFYDTDGQPHASEDFAFAEASERGTTLYFARRQGGKSAEDPIVAGDEVSIWEVTTDIAQTPSEDGYRIARIPLAVRRFAKNVIVVAGS